MRRLRKKLSENKIIYFLWNKTYLFILKKKAIKKGKKRIKGDCMITLDGMHSSFFLPWYKTDLIQQSIFVYEKYYEQDYLDKYIFESFNGAVAKYIRGKAILDIGSNIGNHSLYLKNEAQCGVIYAFEPVKDTYEILKKNMEINNIFDCRLYNKGCGKQSNVRGKIIHFHHTNSGGAKILADDNGDIELIAIDELDIKDKIAFIKIDTEGFEKDVIDGAISTIARDKPFMMIEIANNNVEIVTKQLIELGYRLERFDKENFFFYDPNKIL